MQMEIDTFLNEVRKKTGLPDDETARRAAEAVLAVLGERLLNRERELVAEVLPRELARAIAEQKYDRDFDHHELYRRIARRQGLDAGFGKEHADAVLAVLAFALGHDRSARLRAALPEPVAEALVPRRTPSPPDRLPTGEGQTLSKGRPGSTRPISEARPMQTDSLAESENPHGAAKLSSAPGVREERRDQTLSRGHPGSDKPLSESEE